MSAPTPPELPSFTDKAGFFAKAQALFVWLTTTFLTWIDGVSRAMNFNSTNDASTTSLTIGAGTKSLTVSVSKSYLGGMYVVLASTAAPSTNSMVGQVTSYNTGTGELVVEVLAGGVKGSGTFAAWTISQTAAPSAQIAATFVPVSSAATLADSRTALDVYSKAETLAAIPSPQGYRNPVLNGDFSVDQEFAGAAVTVTAGAALRYVIDGWYAWCTGANVTFQTTTVAGRKRARFTGLAGNTLVGFATRMEAANTADFALKFATLRMLLSSSSITTVNWGLYYATTTNTFGTVAARTRTTIQTGTFTITSTEAAYSAITSAALAAGATTGLELEITVGALLGSQTLTIGDVQVEQGSIAVPVFERVDITEQTRRCMRYKWPILRHVGTAANAAVAIFNIQHPGMFAAPTPTQSAVLQVSNESASNYTQSSTNLTINENSADSGRYRADNFTGMTANHFANLISSGGKIFLNAPIP